MNLENEVLITLHNALKVSLSVKMVHKRIRHHLGAEPGEPPLFHEVAKTMNRLMNLGHIRVAGELQEGLDMYPAYQLTGAGEHAACTARHQERAQSLAGTAKPRSAS